MLLTSALDGAGLHVNSAAPALSGPGLEALARQYMEVQAIIKRWARRYDERLLEQLIYMPVVTAAEFDRADWMRDWTRELAQQLNALSRQSAQLSRGAAASADGHPPRVLVSKTEHGSVTEKALPREFFESAEYRRIVELGKTLAGLIGEGAYVTRGEPARRDRLVQAGHQLAVRPGAQGPDHPALQGSRRDEPRAALGHHHQSRDAPAACRCASRTPGVGRNLHHADGRPGRAAPRVHREERAGGGEPRHLMVSGLNESFVELIPYPYRFTPAMMRVRHAPPAAGHTSDVRHESRPHRIARLRVLYDGRHQRKQAPAVHSSRFRRNAPGHCWAHLLAEYAVIRFRDPVRKSCNQRAQGRVANWRARRQDRRSLRVAAELSANINGGNSAVDRHVIARPFWSADSRSIYFFGHDSGENRRLFVVHGDTAAKALTPADVDIVDCTEDAGTVLCFAGPDIKSGITYAADDLDNLRTGAGDGQALGDLLFPNSRRTHRDSPTEFELWLIKGHDANRIIEKPSGKPLRLLGSYYTGVMSLSPDRRQAVVIAHASSIPASWESLRVPDYVSNARFNADPAQELEAGEALAKRGGTTPEPGNTSSLTLNAAGWRRCSTRRRQISCAATTATTGFAGLRMARASPPPPPIYRPTAGTLNRRRAGLACSL